MNVKELIAELKKHDGGLPAKVVLVSATGSESYFKLMGIQETDTRIELIIHGN